MFAVMDRRSGKFLRDFSGSFNDFSSDCRLKLSKKLSDGEYTALDYVNQKNWPTEEQLHDEMFSLRSPNGAKLYKKKSAVSASFYSQRYCTTADGYFKRRPLEIALPWLVIVPVQVTVAPQDESDE